MKTKQIKTLESEPADGPDETISDTPKTELKKNRSYGVIGLLFLVIILAVSGAGAGYYVWQQQLVLQQQQIEHQQQLLAQVQQVDEYRLVSKQQMQAHKGMIEQLQSDIATLKDLSQNALLVSKRGQRGWVLAEIDYLLRLSTRRLQIARDINGAVAALSAASERLYELGDLSLFPVRQQLAKEISKLKALRQIDVDGIALSLDQMIQIVNGLPYKTTQQEIKSQVNESNKAPAIEKNDGFVDSVISTVMSMGDIKIHQRSIQPASSAQQQQQFQQLLRTHLLSARLAVLRYDQQQFSYDLVQLLKILEQHYQQDDSRVKQMKNDLLTFSNINLTPDLPSITGSWSLLQTLSENHKNNKQEKGQ